MPWVKLDDATYENPKVLAAGPLAELLWRRSIEYSARNLTDGFIPLRAVPSLVNWDGVATYGAKEHEAQVMGWRVRSYALADLLVDADLWAEVDGGYVIHDYLQYQPSREQVEQDRHKNAKYQAAHRERKALSKTLLSPESDARKGPVREPPYPVPYPEELTTPDIPATAVAVEGGTGGDAARTARTAAAAVINLASVSKDAARVLTVWREAHGKARPPKLNPTQVAKLEAAVTDLGVERLCESARWSAEQGIPEFVKAIRAAYTKRQRDEAPTPNGATRHSARSIGRQNYTAADLRSWAAEYRIEVDPE